MTAQLDVRQGRVPVPGLPVADLEPVEADLARAPVLGWMRALIGWLGDGRQVEAFARIPPEQVKSLATELAMENADGLSRRLRVDIATRWAVEAGLARMRGGVLRPVRQRLPLLNDPAALWFRMLAALTQPDMAFTDLLAEHAGGHYRGYSVGEDVADIVMEVADGAGTPGERELADWYRRQWSLGASGEKAAEHAVATLALMAQSLGLIVPKGSGGGWSVTALGRVHAALGQLNGWRAVGAHTAIGLVGFPERPAQRDWVVKISLSQLGAWRRLLVPGNLTAYDLHLVIQAAFGWDDDHLHVLGAGPFKLSSAEFELPGNVPSEVVTLADLHALGVRELSYRYHQGNCWDHQLTVEEARPGGAAAPLCLAGRGTTPPQDGGWMEDSDGNPDLFTQPEPRRVYDLARINQELADQFGDGLPARGGRAPQETLKWRRWDRAKRSLGAAVPMGPPCRGVRWHGPHPERTRERR